MTWDDWPYLILIYLFLGSAIGFLYWFTMKKENRYLVKDLIDFIGVFAILWAPLPFVAAGWYVFEKIKQHIERKEQ